MVPGSYVPGFTTTGTWAPTGVSVVNGKVVSGTFNGPTNAGMLSTSSSRVDSSVITSVTLTDASSMLTFFFIFFC